MAILNIEEIVTGQVGLIPSEIYINTNDTLATVTTAGYLNSAKQTGFNFSNTQLAHVFGIDFQNGSPGCLDFQVSTPSNPGTGNYSLVATSSGSGAAIQLPVTAGHLASFENNSTIEDSGVSFPGGYTFAGTLTANTAVTFPTSGTLATTAGLPSLPLSSANGGTGLNNGAYTLTLGANSTINQDVSTTASPAFTGLSVTNPVAYQRFVSLQDILLVTGGTWTMNRVTAGNYALTTSGAATSVFGIDITPEISTASSKGFELESINFIYAIGLEALTAHSAVLTLTSFTDNSAVSLSTISLTGSLVTSNRAGLYVSNIAVASPAFDNTANSKYVIDLTVETQSSTNYTLYGLVLNFNATIA